MTRDADPSLPAELERRLVALEEKASFTEDLLDTLDAAVRAQQARIDLLVREVARLKERAGPDDPAAGADERPPHY